MKKMMILFAMLLLVLPTMALAETRTYCLNTTYSQHNETLIIDNATVDISNMIYCDNGCSTSLGDCRTNSSVEVIAIIIILIVLWLFIKFTKSMPTIFYSVLVLAVLASVNIGLSDIFASPLNLIFLVLPLGIIIYGVSFYKKAKDDYEDVDLIGDD